MDPFAEGKEGHAQPEDWDSQEETSGFASFGPAGSAAWQFACVT
jgi:hypothetical protein